MAFAVFLTTLLAWEGGLSYCKQCLLYVPIDFEKIIQMELCLTPADVDV
jgi:hypothetical protein